MKAIHRKIFTDKRNPGCKGKFYKKNNSRARIAIETLYPSRGADALDMECISLEDAGLEDAYQGDTVPAAQREYYQEES